MPTTKQVIFVCALVCGLISTVAAQESTMAAKTTLTITANATGERVRVTAPSSVVQLHLEVYAASGEKVFDQELRGANVFDWHLQNGQAQRLAPGAYVCVVTAKSVSGRITQKLGTVTVGEKSASVQAGSLQLSLQQTQAIGPVEADSSWTIAGENEPQTPTVIANDGTDGQMIRGRGALTFRVGNFFSGIDTEQMRLTEAGDLGIGTSTPQSKLDVAGAIRAERFLVVKPKLASSDKTTTGTATTDSSDSVQPLIAGTGTQNQIARWTDNSGTLGDSGITENGGNVGLGTTTPGAPLEAYKAAGANANGGGVLVSRYNDGAGTFRGGAIYSRFISAVNYDALIFGVTSAGIKNPYADFDQARMAILANGNVGIGTTMPGAPLEAYKAAGANANGGGVLVSRYNDGAGTFRGGAIYSRFISAVNNDALVFGVTSAGTKNPYTDFDQARMAILANGNVGIGTTAPATPLEVNGLLRSTRNGAAAQYLQLWGGDSASIRLTAQSSGAIGDKPLLIQNLSGLEEPDFHNAIQFQLGTTAAPDTKMIINVEGKVGIGTTNPNFGRLEVMTTTTETGVYVRSIGNAVYGFGSSFIGVWGDSDSGVGVRAESNSGNLVEGYALVSGNTLRRFHISNDGSYVAGSDFAEALPATGNRAGYEPGDVLVVSTKAPGKVEKASRPYDQRVAGIYSTRPGMLGADKNGASRVDKDDVPVAIVGIVPTKVSAMSGRIRLGDLLTTSSTPGYAMRCANHAKCVGAIVGKALEPLTAGHGIIKVLVMLR